MGLPNVFSLISLRLSGGGHLGVIMYSGLCMLSFFLTDGSKTVFACMSLD
jgi:hypothetical protein